MHKKSAFTSYQRKTLQNTQCAINILIKKQMETLKVSFTLDGPLTYVDPAAYQLQSSHL